MSKTSTKNKVRKLAYSREQMREYMRNYRANHPIQNPKKPGRKKSPARLLEIARQDWVDFPLEWGAVREWIKNHLDLWNQSEDACLWEHLSLYKLNDFGAVMDVPWTPATPYYSRLGHVISMEDYIIEKMDAARERIAAYC